MQSLSPAAATGRDSAAQYVLSPLESLAARADQMPQLMTINTGNISSPLPLSKKRKYLADNADDASMVPATPACDAAVAPAPAITPSAAASSARGILDAAAAAPVGMSFFQVALAAANAAKLSGTIS